jgi:nicotinamide mononucleotide transporter
MAKLKTFDYLFMLFGVLLQVICFLFTNDAWLSFICGLSGAINVVLCSQRKMSFYFFAYIQMFTYIVIIFQQHLWGELIENIFYFVTTTMALFMWLKHYNKEEKVVEANQLTINGWILNGIILTVCTILLYIILLHTNDPEPFLDSISTVPAFMAQILLMLRYREQWILWLIVDVSSLVLWISVGNIFMVMQFVFWTLNCIYGFVKWSK